MSVYTKSDEERKISSAGDDFRGPFGRDRDRILYSSAFRRLAGKTQVLAASELGDYHNRMTHSLKVAQLGRRLAEYLRFQSGPGSEAPNPEIVEAACLAHDLGHPPFGHAGEEALRDVADELILEEESQRLAKGVPEAAIKAEFGGFEGNAQTLRILVCLAARHPIRSRGLDLTRAVLDATMKYPWLRQESDKGARKWNVYPEDLQYAEWIRGENGLGPGSNQCVEATLMDWCDDVTYACHDLQDFYRAGIVPLHQIFDFAASSAATAGNDVPSPFAEDVAQNLSDDFAARDKDFAVDVVLGAMSKLATLLTVDSPYDGSRETRAAMHQSTSALITHFMDAVKVKSGTAARFQGEIHISEPVRVEVEVLKQLIWTYVIGQPALRSQQLGQQKIVRDLLHIFYENKGDAHSLLPRDRQEDLDRGAPYLRCCIDHVASMTESAAIALHQRLTGTHIGLHSDGSWRV